MIFLMEPPDCLPQHSRYQLTNGREGMFKRQGIISRVPRLVFRSPNLWKNGVLLMGLITP